MSMWELVLLLTAVAFISAMASSGNLKLGIRYKGFLEPPPESNINMEKEKALLLLKPDLDEKI